MPTIKNIVKHIVRKKLPYRIRPNLPSATFESIKLVLAYYALAKPSATFIQIGACDGTTDDAVHSLLKKLPIRSVLLEPMPWNFELLEQAYSKASHVNLMCAAIGNSNGMQPIFHARNEGRWKDSDVAKQWASFDKGHLLKHGVKEVEIDQTEVEVVTLDKICERYGFSEIDVLQVDTEGFDAQVVRMALKSENQPSCIYFEYIHICKEMKELMGELKASGYSFTYDKWNVLALKADLFQ